VYIYIYRQEVGPPPHIGPNPPNTHNPSPKYKKHSLNPHPPHTVETLATTDVKTGLKLREHRGGQPLGEDGNALVDKVKINLNMLGALVLNGVGGEVDDAYVVAVDQSTPRQGAVQLHKQLMKPACLCHAVGHNAVLCLNVRAGDDALTL
jgi:hypothetical protein